MGNSVSTSEQPDLFHGCSARPFHAESFKGTDAGGCAEQWNRKILIAQKNKKYM